MVQMRCSNIKFDGEKLEPYFRKPFDYLIVMNESEEVKRATSLSESGPLSIWRPQGIRTYLP